MNASHTSPRPPVDRSQAEQLITAMSVAFVQTNATFEKADPQQGAAALVHLQAMFLAAMPEHQVRKVYRKSMDKSLSIALAKMLSRKENSDG